MLGELEGWRKANVPPLFRKGKKENPENYRLVSFIPISREMMEQLILENTSRHVKEKKITRSSQYGSSEQKSCLMIIFHSKMANLMEEEKAVHILFLVLTDAFDTTLIRPS